MDRFVGHTFVVQDRVEQFYDERTRRVVRPPRSVLLRGAHCDGAQLFNPGDCDRSCPVFWHDAWLERVEADSAPPPHRPARAAAGRWQVGDRVRIAPAEQILASAPGSAQAQGVCFTPATMAAFCGKEAVVARRVTRAYDEARRRHFSISGAVVLEGLSCPGAALSTGGRCQRGCALLWRDAWLLPA
jgi:hypothetical protein